jgi:hypothetical protein
MLRWLRERVAGTPGGRRSAEAALTLENAQLRAQLAGVGKERDDLRREYEKLLQNNWTHEIGLRDTRLRAWRYCATKYEWQIRVLQGVVGLVGHERARGTRPACRTFCSWPLQTIIRMMVFAVSLVASVGR